MTPKTPHFPPYRTRTVEVLTYPAVQILDVTGPVQVFASANEIMKKTAGIAPYTIRLVAMGRGEVIASAGVPLGVQPLSADDMEVDTLLVAGGPGVEEAASDPELLSWLVVRSGRARRTASVCTGALLLAAAGLLDGKRATTHWSFHTDLGRRFPKILIEADPIFIRDGTVWTSAGVTSGIDLALALVEEDLGPTVALAVARYLVVFLKRPGGQAQFSETLALQMADDRFGSLHEWINSNLAEQLSLPVLAGQAGMSERSFSRRYMEATGLTPTRAVERLRVEAARRLLLETRLSIKSICRRCGFGSEETMRRSFMRLLSTTPHDYRARFTMQQRDGAESVA